MENAQKRIAADGESKLPEEIIEHIQSLITDQRDAARTSLLSKSWHDAWFTRPNLSLDQTKFRNRIDEFPIFTKKTMQRYEDLNRNIKIFKLCLLGGTHDSVGRELILKAIKLGATDLTIEFPTSDKSRCFVLPDEVLESETLVRLSVLGLTIDLERRNKAVACSNLKFLKLTHASVNGDLVRDLISRCPSIEELTVIHTTSTSTTTTSSFGNERRRWSPSHNQFDNLKCLRLISLGVKLHDYEELWNKSPSLKVLVIWDDECEHVRICSTSLERITIRLSRNEIWKSGWNGEFDIPNIRNFETSGCSMQVPRIKIKSSDNREWEIRSRDMQRNCSLEPIAYCFSSLNNLVETQRLSRFSLSIFPELYPYV
ncbi:F-box protein At5g03100-like [Salvia miltiorrhiza]|uniref:F-box protein At5g03100-like n=1 Tax=Salvia miltiorrhiza TaxID=226208 RepID=UPI0025ABB008|nr:F-box protein At5g03100-like [Salvia miltiorrhiza]